MKSAARLIRANIPSLAACVSTRLKRDVNDIVPNLGSGGFTLAEVLAALLFMAIVIPVAVQGLQIANRAGEVAQRKSQAARIAERILNENIVTTNWNQSSQVGTLYEGTREFRWTLRSQPWSQNLTNQVPAETASMGQLMGGQPQVTATAASQTTLNLLSVEVSYTVQNRDYLLHLSTLVNSLQ
jgi:type II secretory pathway pseudopilin PulG